MPGTVTAVDGIGTALVKQDGHDDAYCWTEYQTLDRLPVTWSLDFEDNEFEQVLQAEQQRADKPFVKFVSPAFTFGRHAGARLVLSPRDWRSGAGEKSVMELSLPSGYNDISDMEFFLVELTEGVNHVVQDWWNRVQFDGLRATAKSLVFHVTPGCEVMGDIIDCTDGAKWKLRDIKRLTNEISQGWSVHSPDISLGETEGRLELFPNGQFTTEKRHCSLFVWPNGNAVAWRLKVGSISLVLDTRLLPDATDEKACWGFDHFSTTRALIDASCEDGSIEVVVQDVSIPDKPPMKRPRHGM